MKKYITCLKTVTYFIPLLFSITASAVAYDVRIEGMDGKQHNLNGYIGNGKWTVLNIWGTDCPPCREEIPDLVQFHDNHKDDDATVVGIAIDFPSFSYAKKSDVDAFADDYMIDFPLFLSDGSITQQLGLGRLEGLPTTYMFTPAGELVAMQVGGITKEILETFIKKFGKKN